MPHALVVTPGRIAPPGFYLTEGGLNPLHRNYARSVADLSARNRGGRPYLYRVLLRDRASMTTGEVPQADWNNMAAAAAAPPNPNLLNHAGNHLMTAVIVQNDPARQIKVNAAAFNRVMVMPPDPSGDDALEWLKAVFKP